MKPFKSFRPIQIRWNEKLGRSECPYMKRWVFNFGLFSIRIHKWYRSDDSRFMHDHTFNFITLVLKGSYDDISPTKKDKLKAGSVRFRKAEHIHYVKVPETGCTTLLLCSPPKRNWGFWIGKKFVRPLKYFDKYGHVPCDIQ